MSLRKYASEKQTKKIRPHNLMIYTAFSTQILYILFVMFLNEK